MVLGKQLIKISDLTSDFYRLQTVWKKRNGLLSSFFLPFVWQMVLDFQDSDIRRRLPAEEDPESSFSTSTPQQPCIMGRTSKNASGHLKTKMERNPVCTMIFLYIQTIIWARCFLGQHMVISQNTFFTRVLPTILMTFLLPLGIRDCTQECLTCDHIPSTFYLDTGSH